MSAKEIKTVAERITGLKLVVRSYRCFGLNEAWVQTKHGESFWPHKEDLEMAGFTVTSSNMAIGKVA